MGNTSRGQHSDCFPVLKPRDRRTESISFFFGPHLHILGINFDPPAVPFLRLITTEPPTSTRDRSTKDTDGLLVQAPTVQGVEHVTIGAGAATLPLIAGVQHVSHIESSSRGARGTAGR